MRLESRVRDQLGAKLSEENLLDILVRVEAFLDNRPLLAVEKTEFILPFSFFKEPSPTSSSEAVPRLTLVLNFFQSPCWLFELGEGFFKVLEVDVRE